MRIVFLLLSVMLFVLLALDFSQLDSSHSSLSVSRHASPASSSTSEVDETDTTIEDEGLAAPTQSAPPSRQVPTDNEPAPATTEPEPTPTPKPAPAAVQSDASMAAQIEAEVLRLSNIERTKIGLNELTLDETLASTARAHSKDMIERDFFNHDNPDGCSSSCRATAAGYRWRMVGENIHMMSGWELNVLEAAVMIVQGWMSSPGHKENLLKPGYEETGVGIIVQGDTVYSTAMYGTER